MDSIIPYEEGLVCQACGDEGFTNAFIYCVKCLGYVVHRYCLDVTPETYDEFVFWYCDDCKPAGPYKYLLPKPYLSGPDKEDPTSTAILSTFYHEKKLKKKHLKRRQMKKRKIVHLLAGHGEVSCPPKKELDKLATVPRRLNRCVVLGLAKDVSQKHSIGSAQLASCSPVKEITVLTHEHSQPLKEDATRSLHVKTIPNKKKLEMKHNKKQKTASLVPDEDKTSSPKEATKTHDEFAIQTNSVLKEALVKSDPVSNQISPSAEMVVYPRKIVHLLTGNGEVSCPANEELEKLDTVPSRLNPCVVLGLQKDISQKQSIESGQLTSCSPVKESTLLTHEPSQHLKEDATRSLHVKTTPSKKLKMKKKIASLVAEEDKTSYAKEATKTNDESVLQTNSVLKEALGKSDSVPNQISASAEKVGSQKQSAGLHNNCSPLKENAKRERDASSLKTKKQNFLDPIENSSCESSCTDTTVKIQEEGQNCEGKQSKPGHDTLVSDSVTEKLIKNPKDCVDQLKMENRMRNELNIRVSTAANGAPQLADVNSSVGSYQPARPVLEPAWRGSFNIVEREYDIFEGFIAHLSSKACLKVCNEAATLSSLLRLEMQPKNALWPKSFLESHPSDENIALYFFPGDPKNERVFEQLVDDMIDEELAMKATSKNAELLIFASKLLPQPYWRFQGNYYMWGVFRGKKNESSSAVVQDVTVSNTSNNHRPERNEVNSVRDVVTRVKTSDSMSPQSPLSSYR